MKKNLLFLILGIIFILFSVNAFSDSSKLCLQEFANETSACGGLAMDNSYTFTGTWNPTLTTNFTIDGNWTSYATQIGTPAYLNIVYKKPAGATNNSFWQIGYLGTGGTDPLKFNVSINQSCWDYNATHLLFRITSTSSTSSNFECYSGPSTTVSVRNLNGGYAGWIVEEAMWWNITTISVTQLSPASGTFFNTTTPTVYFNATATTLLNCSLLINDGSGYQSFGTNYTINGTSSLTANSTVNEGYNLWKINCSDVSSETNSIEKSFIIDTVKPDLDFSNHNTNAHSITLNYTFAEDYISNCSLYVNGILNQTDTTVQSNPNIVLNKYFQINNANWTYIENNESFSGAYMDRGGGGSSTPVAASFNISKPYDAGGTVYFDAGDYAGVYQIIDFTNISKLYFRVYTTTDYPDHFNFSVVMNDVEAGTWRLTGNALYNVWLTSTGTQNVSFRMKYANTTETAWTTGDTLQIDYIRVYEKERNFTIPLNFTVEGERINYSIVCLDKAGNINTNVTANITYDIVSPTISINQPYLNNSIVSAYRRNLTINITYNDTNLFQTSVNVTCAKSGQIYYAEDLDLSTTPYNNLTIINLTNISPQICYYYIYATDDHTAKKIPNYRADGITRKITFKTENDITAQIESQDFSMVNAKKGDDRYTFSFDFNDNKNERKFKVTSTDKIYYREGSEYPAHFVIWNEKLHRGNWIDFATKDITSSSVGIDELPIEYKQQQNEYEIIKNSDYDYDVIIKSDKKIDKIDFQSIGGTNVYNVSGSFYIGGSINLSTRNIYDNSTFGNFTVVVSPVTGNIGGWDGIGTITGKTDWLENLTNGTYLIGFRDNQNRFFNQSYSLTVENYTQALEYSSFQAQLNVMARNVKSLAYFTGINISLNNSGTFSSSNNTASTTTTFLLNASTYNVLIKNYGFDDYKTSTTLSYLMNYTLIADMNFLVYFSLIDEATLGAFNVSRTNRTEYSLICPTGTWNYNITNSTPYLPITCDYDYIRFIWTYGAVQLYRTYLDVISENLSQNNTVYLFDATTTTSVTTNFQIDDLYEQYENVSIWIMKNINNDYALITADYVDLENKIIGYLIQNHEYEIEVRSSNKPRKIIGNYIANEAGTKLIRLYDIQINPSDATSSEKTTNLLATVYNNTAVILYQDTQNLTYQIDIRLYENTTNSVPLFNYTGYNISNAVIEMPLYSYANSTIQIYAQAYRTNETSIVLVKTLQVKKVTSPIPFLPYVPREFLRWVLVILLGVIALYSTSRSAPYVTLLIGGMTLVFSIMFFAGSFGSQLLVGAMGFVMLIGLIMLLKSVFDKGQVS